MAFTHLLSGGSASRVLALVIACASLGRAQTPAAAAQSGAPNLLVISVDALRRDHLSAYGYARATSPRLDAFLAESVVFDNAFAPITRPIPAHVSLWTASWPHRHGVVAHGGVKNVFASSAQRRSAAELLRDAGAKTAAFVSIYTLGAVSGLNAGFEFVDEPARADSGVREVTRAPAELADRAGRWLSHQKKARFTLWTHFEAPAEPNDPDARFVKLFRGDGRSEEWLTSHGIEPSRFQLGFPTMLVIRMFFPELEGTVNPTPDLPLPKIETSTYVNLLERYDADIRAVDEAVGTLLDGLAELGLEESTVVVLTGAYGQSLGERTHLGGGETTLENAVVPMAIRFPKALGVAPRRVSALASTIDLLPTALARSQPEVAAKLVAQGDGLDLLAEGASREFVLTQRTKRENARNDPGPIYAWRSAEWTYVHRPQLTDYLFDRKVDPQELDNLSVKQPERAAELGERARAAFGLTTGSKK